MAQTEVMPVHEQRIGRPSDPCVMVIFGAAGDLTRRKLIPALYNLARAHLLSPNFAIIGVAHTPTTTEEFRERLSSGIKEYADGDLDPKLWSWFEERLYYVTAEFDDKQMYAHLGELLDKADKDHSTNGNYFFYLATSADFFGPIVEQLSACGLMDEKNGQRWRRVIIEKPFG